MGPKAAGTAGRAGDRQLSRRDLLRGGAGALAATAAFGVSSFARRVSGRSRPDSEGREVAVLGGGMAGLTAAHELAERGFDVTVYERRSTLLGGKARSIPVPGTATGGRRALPGEHGFRFFPGFYHHVPDTMRRIPLRGGRPGTVYDNLVDADDTKLARTGGRPDGFLFGFTFDPREALTPEGLRAILTRELVEGQHLPPHEAAHFAERLVVFFTSSDARRYGQWEHVSWWDYIDAGNRSREYQEVAARGLTRTLVAAKETVASARTIGTMAEAFTYTIMGRGNDGAVDRLLNAPTNEAWIDPWEALLRKLGVRFEMDARVRHLAVRGGRIASAQVVDSRGRCRSVSADWFVAAMPMERVRQLLTPGILRLDPSLEGLDDLFVDWMSGIMLYLRDRVDIVRGHITFADAPWALTGLTQAQFWEHRDFAADYGDGGAVDCLSVDISDWDTPGILFDKPARRCSPEQMKAEVWAQVKAHLEDRGETVLPDGILHSWFLDPAIGWDPGTGRSTNDEPLLVNTVSTWEKRPGASTAIQNLFLSGDYCRTDVDLATMEGANASARSAVNALLEAAGSDAPRAAKYALYDPPEFEALKRLDARLFAAGQRHPLDTGSRAATPGDRAVLEPWRDPNPRRSRCTPHP